MSQPEVDLPVIHNVGASRFEAAVAGHLAVADYLRRDGDVVMTHTLVPVELRGRGLAEKLVRAALEWARRENLRVVPACSYVATFIARHPEYRGLTG